MFDPIATMNLSNAVIPLSAVGVVLLAGATYGRVNAKIEEAHSRITKLEENLLRREAALDKKLDEISDTLSDLRVLIERNHNKEK